MKSQNIPLVGSIIRERCRNSMRGFRPMRPALNTSSESGGQTVSVVLYAKATLLGKQPEVSFAARNATARPLQPLVRYLRVRNKPEAWRKCSWPAACPWFGELPNGLGLAAQATTRHGAAWKRQTEW